MNIVALLLFTISPVISVTIDGNYSSVEPSLQDSELRFAMLDDVRLLANGLLQIGHGLKDFAVKTKRQMDDIFHKLNIFDQSFYELLQQTNEIKEEEKQLRKTTSRLQANNEEIKNLSLELNSKIEILSQERIQLQDKVGRLEEKLTKLFHTQPEIQERAEIVSLKNFGEKQDNSLSYLHTVVQGLLAQYDKQQKQIQPLEEKINNTGFQGDIQTAFLLKTHEAKNTHDNTTASIQDYKSNATDCTWIHNRGEQFSGIYSIKPNRSNTFNVYCEMTTERSWTVIQNRVDGSLDFNQTWESYINGFGNLEGEFWLGLHKIHSIVDQAHYILRAELEDWKANKHYIEYTLIMGGPETDYTARLAKVTGNIPSALPEQKEVKFSIKDNGKNTEENSDCPENYSGGWWHNECEEINLNGKYTMPTSKGKLERRKRGLYWKPHKGRSYLLKSTKLMLHPIEFENFD
ncbi:angiopoietin-related protein 3 isoform X1 [Sphaerodactylus townsendi]|uniref:angiopoietin-related protein 3 isoform X1 n=1 Tax=Sphaerodactylus townsendi TaxID=933632 RepID=UPI002025FB76|nr:angiopoietin-related protein 3 isoform X1 [Sphaerodactylus townsendi]